MGVRQQVGQRRCGGASRQEVGMHGSRGKGACETACNSHAALSRMSPQGTTFPRAESCVLRTLAPEPKPGIPGRRRVELGAGRCTCFNLRPAAPCYVTDAPPGRGLGGPRGGRCPADGGEDGRHPAGRAGGERGGGGAGGAHRVHQKVSGLGGPGAGGIRGWGEQYFIARRGEETAKGMGGQRALPSVHTRTENG